MTSFQDILAGKVTPTDAERADLVRNFLKKSYQIKAPISDEILSSLLMVHSHAGSEDRHFAHPQFDSAEGRAVVQIFWLTGNWHLGFTLYPKAEMDAIHPKAESVSWGRSENQLLRKTVEKVLTSATIATTTLPAANALGSTPKAIISGDSMVVHIPDAPEVDDAVAAGGSIDGLLGLDGGDSKSVAIDLSDFNYDQ